MSRKIKIQQNNSSLSTHNSSFKRLDDYIQLVPIRLKSKKDDKLQRHFQ